MENNTSGQGEASEIPVEIQGWNWGAFLLTWVWGIGNNTYRAFWMFFPIVNFFMLVFLGLKGNEWAWRHRKWESVAHFRLVQRTWAKAGFALVGITLIFMFVMFFVIGSFMKDSEPYKLSMNYITDSPEVVSRIGMPIKSGFVTGRMRTDSAASLAYSIEGQNGEARVAVKATMVLSAWSIQCLVVNYKDSNEKTVLIPCD